MKRTATQNLKNVSSGGLLCTR